MKKALEWLLVWLAMWVCLHGAHWMLIHYFASVLPAALAPATWTGDGIDALVATAGLELQDYIHKRMEKKLNRQPQEPTPPQAATLPIRSNAKHKREGEEQVQDWAERQWHLVAERLSFNSSPAFQCRVFMSCAEEHS